MCLAMALAASVLTGSRVDAADANMTSQQVAAEIVRVQDQADATAQRWAVADRRSEDLAIELQTAEQQLATMSDELARMDAQMATIAVDRFTGSTGPGTLFFLGNPTEMLQVDVLRGVALDVGAQDIDTAEALRSDVDDRRSAVAALQQENAAVVEQLAATQSDLESQLVQLDALHDRLQEREVKQAYEALIAQRRAELLDQQRRAAAEAAAVTTSQPPKGSGAQVSTPALPSSSPVSAQPASAPQTQAPSAPPIAAPSPTPKPVPAPAVVVNSGWLCPVSGPNAFGDTWGAARSGGRQHQGVDMMSPFGTPVVAVVAGSVTMKTNTLGGNAIWLTGVDGAKYYYAHLSSWEGSSRSVSAGEVIGYVGATGNTTANHLHFEIHPGGGAAVNPYSTVRQRC
jgi:murein DD-endopeptidase MepM/ murein hydrolase activator NlpD